VVFISSELPELIGLADRLLVFFRGEVRAEFSREEMREELIAHVAVTGSAAGNDIYKPTGEIG
jgi:ABC-type sugar transport system ATPase subunit